MSRTYKSVMLGSGTLATVVTIAWITLAMVAMGDGRGGVRIPGEIDILCMLVIMVGSGLSGGAWIAARAAKDSATTGLRPMIRMEIDRGLEAALPDLVEQVAAELKLRLDSILADVASRAVGRHSAELRALITGEVMSEQLDAAVAKARRFGMLQQAQMSGGVAKVTNLYARSVDE